MNLKLIIRRLFCKHIYKDIDEEYLTKIRELDGGEKWGCPTYSNYKYYTIKQECIKCGKIHYKQKRVLLI